MNMQTLIPNAAITVGDCHPELDRGDVFHRCVPWGAGSATVEEATLLYSLVLTWKPRVILETGLYHGWTAAHMAMGCKHNGLGALFTIELDRDMIAIASANLNSVGLGHHVTVIEGMATERIHQLCQGGITPDLALIDTDIPVRMAEVEAVSSYMGRGGLVAVHDTNPAHPFGKSHHLLENLARFSASRGWSLIQVPSPRGLTLLQKT